MSGAEVNPTPSPEKPEFRNVSVEEDQELLEKIDWDKCPEAILEPGTRLEQAVRYISAADIYGEQPVAVRRIMMGFENTLILDNPADHVVTLHRDGALGRWEATDITPIPEDHKRIPEASFWEMARGLDWRAAAPCVVEFFDQKINARKIPLKEVVGSTFFILEKDHQNAVGSHTHSFPDATQASVVLCPGNRQLRISLNATLGEPRTL